MHDCGSTVDSVAKGFPCFHDFSYCASHPYISIIHLCNIDALYRTHYATVSIECIIYIYILSSLLMEFEQTPVATL